MKVENKKKLFRGEKAWIQKSRRKDIESEYIYMYKYISVFKLHILSQKNFTKHNVKHPMTIPSQNSLNNIYIYLDLSKYIFLHFNVSSISWMQQTKSRILVLFLL